MDLDTAVLRTLVVVADELHFGRAAARLGISQQALSKRMSRLEAQLGGPLVDRTDRRRLRLTALGQGVLPLAAEVVEVTDRIGARTAGSPRLRVDIMGDYLAPQRWTHRAARSAGLPVDVVERPAGTTADHLLATGAAEFAFGRAGAVPRPWPRDLRHRRVLFEPLALITRRDHPWAQREHVPLGELSGHTLWFPLAAAPVEWRTYLAELSDTFGVVLDSTGSTFGYRQWMDDVAHGDVPPSIVGEAMAPPRPDVAIVPIVDPTPVFPWCLFWRSATSRRLVEQLLGAMGFPAAPARNVAGAWLPASDAAVDAD